MTSSYNETVTLGEIEEYYKSNGITDYPMTKSGKPNMRFQENQRVKFAILKEKLLKKNKLQNLHSYTEKKEDNYRHELTSLSDDEIDSIKKLSEECVICNSPMENEYCKLNCDHKFCVSCIMMHARNNNNCPMCRYEICEKPKKRESISSLMLSHIVHNDLTLVEEYDIFNDHETQLSFQNSFQEDLQDFRTVLENSELSKETKDKYQEEMMLLMINNIQKLGLNIGLRVAKFYDDQL